MDDIKNNEALDAVLNKISLSFGLESLNLIFPADFMAELSLYRVSAIDKTDLDNELVFQSKIFTLFNVLLAYVTDKYSRSDATLKQVEARLSLQHEKTLLASGERVSDKKIEKLVDADQEYITAVNDRLDKKNLVTTFTNIVTALSGKNDNLQMLAAKRNKEIGARQ